MRTFYAMCCLINRGSANSDLGRFEIAIKDFDRAIKAVPDNVTAYYNKGNAYLGWGRFIEAIDAYDQAIEHDEEHLPSHHNKGYACMENKEYDNAIKSF